MVRGPDEPSPPLDAADLAHVLARGEGALRELRGARLLLTGGTGFFGRWLLETLVHANARLGLGARALVVSRDPEAFLASAPHLRDPSLELARGDVRTFEAPGQDFTHAILAATATSKAMNEEARLEAIDTIYAGTRRALQVASACGASRVLFTSSGAIYGPQPSNVAMLGEDHGGGPDPLDPRSAYGEAKRLAELLCVTHGRASGMTAVIARGFAFGGPHLPLDAHFALGNFLRDGLLRERILIEGDGRPVRSYLHAADLAVWLWTLLVRGAAGRAYNVGSEDARPLREVAEVVGRLTGKPVEVRSSPGSGPAPRYVPSIARARRELALEAWIGLEDGIERTLAWHRR